MRDITSVDYKDARRVWGDFEISNLGEYQDLYVQSDTLLHYWKTDVFESFHNKCIKICELEPAQFLSEQGLTWHGCFIKTEVELELLTDVDMSLMVEKGIIGEMCHVIHWYAKQNTVLERLRCKQIINIPHVLGREQSV